MGSFTYNGYEFESRQSEAQNIVWLKGKPDDSEAMPRSFNFQDVAEHFLINRDMPEYNNAPSDYDKEVKLEVAYDLIGNLDDSITQTVWIDKAIKKLEALKYKREHLPF